MHLLPATILSVSAGLGYPVLFLAVAAEAGGIPVPGETALITAGTAAAHHRLQILPVILIAGAGAIVGDNVGYLFGRRVGRRLLQAPGPFRRHRQRVLELGEPFFARHGAKAVFAGRWITGLRTWASWLAGADRMPWRSFAIWNAAGALAWATLIGLLANIVGHTAAGTASLLGALSMVTVATTVAGILLSRRRWRVSSERSGAARSPIARPDESVRDGST